MRVTGFLLASRHLVKSDGLLALGTTGQSSTTMATIASTAVAAVIEAPF
jgi:hypothetical protein